MITFFTIFGINKNFSIIFFLIFQCVETIKCVDRELREVEDDVMTNVDKEIRESAQMLDGERLNFGLVQVVYEWARNKVSDK